MAARNVTAGVLLALAMSPLLGCFDFFSSADDDVQDDNQFREDVILCEEAVARLQRCCPSFDAKSIECRHHYSSTTGCGTTTTTQTDPAFTKDESKCVQDTSCDELVAKGVCGRAQQAGTARTTSTTTHDPDPDTGVTPLPSTTATEPRDPVCP